MSKHLFKALRLAFFISLLAGALTSLSVNAANQSVKVLHVKGTIVPIVADYIDRGISQAEEENATACIIELNTPGGLLEPTEKIVERILNARVPVIVYVSPKGAWAASAGTFITLSGHVAAMMPGTTIGAAHPVSAGGEEIPEEQMKKITEFSAKWMETIAQERGRNIEEAKLAVTESKSFTDVDALENNLIDLRAEDIATLLAEINGQLVTLAGGEEVILETENYVLDRTEMTFVERFLQTISHPNIAYILLSVGSLGIIAEIYSPGALFPGITGAICLLLAFYALNVLDAFWGGILLIILAFGLFVGEALTATFGLFTAGGVAALVLGSLILFPGQPAMFQVDPWLIAVVVLLVTGIVAFVMQRVIQAHRRQAKTGREELAGKTAVVKQDLDPEGLVFFKGERWAAVADKGRIKAGEEVIITEVDGLILRVTKKQ
ncbi:MAG: nodulation protein NfeD [Dehalococcoidia bacterium]|nr:MAG: nodulation protein NfeD [Dehalococcoidia bacterium]